MWVEPTAHPISSGILPTEMLRIWWNMIGLLLGNFKIFQEYLFKGKWTPRRNDIWDDGIRGPWMLDNAWLGNGTVFSPSFSSYGDWGWLIDIHMSKWGLIRSPHAPLNPCRKTSSRWSSTWGMRWSRNRCHSTKKLTAANQDEHKFLLGHMTQTLEVPQLSDFIALSPWADAHLPTDMDLLARYRTDKALAVLGTHTFSELPPGFETRASQSKPGQLVYLDLCLGAGMIAGGG